jgi:cytochrome oxidase maturation protein, cbb3-type
MSVILILILASLAMALLFLGGFIWAVKSGQFEDTLTPSMRVLADEPARAVVRSNNRREETRNREAGSHSEINPTAQ